jgi:hypothetical protein
MKPFRRIVVVDELYGPRRLVAHRLPQLQRGFQKLLPDRTLKPRRRRLLHHFLIPPLHRAIALSERGDRSVAVAEDLHLNMSRIGYESLQIHTTAPEIGLAETADRGKRFA